LNHSLGRKYKIYKGCGLDERKSKVFLIGIRYFGIAEKIIENLPELDKLRKKSKKP